MLTVRPLVDLRLTSPYGWRTHPVTGVRSFHEGADYGGKVGATLYAMGDGVVDDVATTPRGHSGRLVSILDDVDGRYLYLHMDRVDVRVGQRVRAGQRVGTLGATGRVTGPHLHLEWRPLATSRDRFSPTVDPAPIVGQLGDPRTVDPLDGDDGGGGGGGAVALALIAAGVLLS